MAETTNQRAGFGQSTKRTVAEIVIFLALIGALFMGARGCLGLAAERGAGQLPTSVDQQIGKLGAEQMRAQYQLAGKASPAQRARVQAVFDELIAALSPEERTILGEPRVTVVVDSTVNAFALPGGEVFVLTGLLERIGTDDALLRGVLAHELGHAVRRHGVRLLARRAAFSVAIAMLFGQVDDLVVVLAAGASQLDSLSHSREMESEADDFGVSLLARAGHNSEGLARFLESLETQPVPELLSTHPDPKARAEAIRARP